MNAPENMPLIEMESVAIASARDPEKILIEDVNWQLMPGDFWVIAGLHASGKTDFLSTAAGLQRPASGVVRWRGRDVSELHESELVQERKRVGFVFENGGRMLRNLTVAENVALPLRYHRDWTMDEAAGQVEEILKITELLPMAATPAAAISPGWQQRVGLARALALKPEILLVDRPLAGLQQLRWWQAFFKKLSEGIPFLENRPLTLVLTSDELSPWLELGGHFVALKKNRWHVLGKREEWAAENETWRELWLEE
jgi:ABC-type transporter Mla maintaining outer membrane lipid asymmetry ATPase subunit MlaF